MYDFENRLIDRNSGSVQLIYDGDGNRVGKTVGGVTTNYLIDEQNPTGYAQSVEESVTLAGGVVEARAVYAFGLRCESQSRLVGGVWVTHYYGFDGTGSVRTLFDDAGTLTDEYTYGRVWR